MRSRNWARLTATMLFACFLILPACSPGGSTSHAEQVDARVSVRIRLDPDRKIACRRDRCRIHFTASVTTDSGEGVWARQCSLLVLDGDGEVLTTSPIELGFPAGMFTRAGTVSRGNGGAEVEVSKRDQDRIEGLDASCRAYVWHGEPPI